MDTSTVACYTTGRVHGSIGEETSKASVQELCGIHTTYKQSHLSVTAHNNETVHVSSAVRMCTGKHIVSHTSPYLRIAIVVQSLRIG